MTQQEALEIEMLARAVFTAKERLQNLEIMNTPVEYSEREAAFIELVKTKVELKRAEKNLEGYLAAS
jgi:hypothetical protein